MSFHLLDALLWAAGLAALVVSAWTDLKDRIIPNEMVGLVALCGIGLTLSLRPGDTVVGLSAALVVLLGLGVLAHFNLMGGGDVKLISATTLMVAPWHIGHLLIAIALAGGVLSGGYLIAQYMLRKRHQGSLELGETAGGPGREPGGWFSYECARVAAGGPMPYALAILGGVVGYSIIELSLCYPANFCSL